MLHNGLCLAGGVPLHVVLQQLLGRAEIEQPIRACVSASNRNSPPLRVVGQGVVGVNHNKLYKIFVTLRDVYAAKFKGYVGTYT